MDDLIERSALCVSLFPLGNKDAADIYRLIIDAPAVNRWIPVSERMPKTPHEGFGVHFHYSDCVLVAAKDWLGMAYYVTDNGESRWEFADARTMQIIDWVEITHWMPITPPESEVHNE